MAMLRFRITRDEDHVRAIMNLLQSLDGIEHVEEVADLMPHMDDPDSSSAGLSDTIGADTHEIEVEVPNPSTARKVREAVEALAFDLDALVEIEEEERNRSRCLGSFLPSSRRKPEALFNRRMSGHPFSRPRLISRLRVWSP